METLTLEGAELKYHKVGQGPVLICIPGANGTGDIFLPLAQQLKDKFTVVAVDRRGYGDSKLTQPLPARAADPHSEYRVKRDAADIKALAEALSSEPVYVFGTSSGAIVAMHVLKEYPEIINKIIFHEPPINTFLPDAPYWQEKNEEIVQTAQTKGMPQAMKIFGETLHIAPIDAAGMAKQATESDEDTLEQMMNWFKYEIRQYTTSNITIEDLKQYKEKIILLDGLDSKGSFPQEVNGYISQQTGIQIHDIAGGHLGYVQKPKEFAEVIEKLLK